MASRRERRAQRIKREARKPEPQPVAVPQRHRDGLFTRLYRDQYKTLLFLPFILLFLAFIQIGFQVAETGDFLNKGVSLKGGLIINVPATGDANIINTLETQLRTAYPGTDILVRGVSEFGQLQGVMIEVETAIEDQEKLRALEQEILSAVAAELPAARDEYSVEVFGPSLGAAFFAQTIRALIIALILMGAVVFLYFGDGTWQKVAVSILSFLTSFLIFHASGGVSIAAVVILLLVLTYFYLQYSLPSAAVILCAFTDIVVTLAVINVLGIKVSAAGIAAFLMLIGYSVDTDILLSTRVLKHTKGSVYDRVVSSLKTGMTMSLTSAAAALIGYFVSSSDTIKQIMLIILIGLIVDMIATWIQNTGLIRLYAERLERRG